MSGQVVTLRPGARLARRRVMAGALGRGVLPEPAPGVRGSWVHDPSLDGAWASIALSPSTAVAILAQQVPGTKSQFEFGVTMTVGGSSPLPVTYCGGSDLDLTRTECSLYATAPVSWLAGPRIESAGSAWPAPETTPASPSSHSKPRRPAYFCALLMGACMHWMALGRSLGSVTLIVGMIAATGPRESGG